MAVLKDMMDSLENLVQDQIQAAGSVDIEEFKSQLAEMRTQGELPESKFGKRKHRAGESGEEIHVDLSREERRQEKKARKASRKDAREKEALEQ
uniref:Integrase core domain containing protein n=1 Tax=Solanum tuberosum TaxID=4113 RepID=M1DAU0_SOLTU